LNLILFIFLLATCEDLTYKPC